jgi:hypothetical protein
MKMKDREVIELKFAAEEVWGLPCIFCDETAPMVGSGVDEFGHSVSVCERCLRDPEQIDAKLEQQAAELEKHVADFVKQAAWLRSLKGRIKAPSAEWVAAKQKYEAAKKAEEEAILQADLARLEEEGFLTEPPEAEAASKTSINTVTLTLDEWAAWRRAAGLHIDPRNAEVIKTKGWVLDPYGIRPDATVEGREDNIGSNYFARSPGMSVWIEFGDLPEATVHAIWEKHEREQQRNE